MMPSSSRTPRIVPYGADETVYLVVDRFQSGRVYRETEVERTPTPARTGFASGMFITALAQPHGGTRN